jgi:putative nucleotidyltransferase-like protein
MQGTLYKALELLYGPQDQNTVSCELLRQHGLLLLLPQGNKTEIYRQIAAVEIMKQDFFDVAQVLQERKIPFIPIKGLLLSYVLYDDYALRGSTDIDLAIPLDHYEEVIRLLTKVGNTHFPSDYLHKTVEIFSCRKNKTTLELHFALSTAERFSGFLTEFWRDQEEIVLEGRTFAGLSKEVNLIFLLIHLARHIDEPRAIWIEDIRRFLVKFGPVIDWKRFLGLAKKHRLANVLLFTITFCDRIFRQFGQTVHFPQEVVSEIRKCQTTHGRMLYRYLLPKLVNNGMTTWSRRVYSFTLVEEWHERILLMKGFLLRRLQRRV